jgi:hypothetical protein
MRLPGVATVQGSAVIKVEASGTNKEFSAVALHTSHAFGGTQPTFDSALCSRSPAGWSASMSPLRVRNVDLMAD